MNSKETCDAVKKALNARFKSETLLARDIERHLFEDSRVLWGIEGATPNSGRLPDDQMETHLIKGGFAQWQEQVKAWVKGGMKCWPIGKH